MAEAGVVDVWTLVNKRGYKVLLIEAAVMAVSAEGGRSVKAKRS